MAHPTPSPFPAHPPRWLPTGAEAYDRMLAALARSRHSVRLEYYIYRADGTGDRFRAALTAAARRGVRVQLLLDAFGCAGLPADYWREFRHSGGEPRVFNPLTWRLFALRNHRKLLLIDDTVAFIGGYNIGNEYDGDGVTHGWRDFGVELHTPAAIRQLAAAFDSMFVSSGLHHRLFRRVRYPLRHPLGAGRSGPVLLTGPRLGPNRFRTQLLRQLKTARHVQIISSYFIPSFRLRRALRRVARHGGTVELLLAGKSDVPLALLAGRARYGSLLRAGVRIWEYQPQILHSKLAIVDGTVFVGSSNLDARSFGINYELMVRFDDPTLAAAGRKLFAADQRHAVEITLQDWRGSQTWVRRLRGVWAGFLLTKVDPWLAHTQLRALS
jgi:cardiolipin synthase